MNIDIDGEQLARAWKDLREQKNLSRQEFCEITGFPEPLVELAEEWDGGCFELEHLEFMADAYECEPGELLDRARALAFELSRDHAAEADDLEQAKKLLDILRKERAATHADMEAADISINNGPLNVLYDMGYPVESWRATVGLETTTYTGRPDRTRERPVIETIGVKVKDDADISVDPEGVTWPA